MLDALAPVGAADVVDGWAPLRDLELAHGDVSVAGPMRREVHVVPRRVLDARLVERAVAAGAVLRTHRATSLTRTGTPLASGVALGVVSGEVSADVVVGADGAHSFVRTALLGKRREPRAIAIRGYAPTTPEMAGRQVIRYGTAASRPTRGPSTAATGWPTSATASCCRVSVTAVRRAADCSSTSSSCSCPAPPAPATTGAATTSR